MDHVEVMHGPVRPVHAIGPVGDELGVVGRGINAEEAAAMIVSGFIEPIVKELPMEYAVEMNRLIQLQMEGSVG